MKMKIVKVSEMDRITKEKYIKEVKFFLKDLNLEYPLHDIWYEKMIQSMEEKFDREILLALENEFLLGTAVLKKSVDEKKICTLRVKPYFQKKGIGKQLVLKSLEFLETDKPIITVSQQKNHEFKKLLDFYGFNLEAIYWGKYLNNSCVFIYNGILMPETLIQAEQISNKDKLGSYLNISKKIIVA